MTAPTLFSEGIATNAIALKPFWRIRVLGELDDLDRIFEQIIKVAPLDYGKTDQNAFVSAAGLEYYRPKADSRTGGEEETRKRPDVLELSLFIPQEEALLKQIMDIVYTYHSYYEPPLSVSPVLRSETRGLDDSDNPHRWWNNQGDWKQRG